MELFADTPAANAGQPLSHLTDLHAFRQAVLDFDGCPLKAGATQAVISDGDPQARIMLIGEAPGAEEDRLGKPFVGRSGQLLDQMLASIGLSRHGKGPNGEAYGTVYITNTVFWRPPENRTPTPAETASCRPLLDRHIALINPDLILLVGGTAAKTVLQTDTGITKLRLRWHGLKNPYLSKGGPEGGIPCLPTFHPAYLLRNPPAKRDAWTDLKIFRDRAIELGLLDTAMQDHAA